MALSEEQRKRIEENRKRALEIRQKRDERERPARDEAAKIIRLTENMGGFISLADQSDRQKKRKIIDENHAINDSSEESTSNKPKEIKISKTEAETQGTEEDEESLEDFEHNASEYITKSEAQRTYCLPQGTLDVCSYIERDNPHKKGWSNMKLYSRSELRRRARKRFGGKEGLIQERERRKKKRFEKSLEEAKNVFR